MVAAVLIAYVPLAAINDNVITLPLLWAFYAPLLIIGFTVKYVSAAFSTRTRGQQAFADLNRPDRSVHDLM